MDGRFRVAGSSAAFEALPIDVLLELVSHTDVSSAINMTLTSKSLHALQECTYFWLLLLATLKSIRPIPRLAARSTTDDIREGVMTAHKLHIKWTIRRDATSARSHTLAPRSAGKHRAFGYRSSRTLLIDDGVHFVHIDMDFTLKLRRIDTGEIVWELHSKYGELSGLDCTIHGSDIILLFHDRVKGYVGSDSTPRRMDIWRYKGSGKCTRVYSLDISHISREIHASFIHGVYAGCLGDTLTTRTIAISNWLTGTHVSFEVEKPQLYYEPFAMFTNTELLAFQARTDHLFIHRYCLNKLASHMTETTPNAFPTLTSISPDGTYRVELQGPDGRRLNENLLAWSFTGKQIRHSHLLLLGRKEMTTSDSVTTHTMTALLAWAPSTREARSDTDTLVIKAPVTLVMKRNSNAWFSDWLWTWPIAGRRTVGYLAATKDSRNHCPAEITLVDTSGLDTQEDRGRNWEESAMANVFSAQPHFPGLNYGDLLSMDIDDTRGRMAVSTSCGSVVIFEFV